MSLGAKLESCNKEGRTALHWAASKVAGRAWIEAEVMMGKLGRQGRAWIGLAEVMMGKVGR